MQIFLRFARAHPVTIAAFVFALLSWQNAELRNGLLISGLLWIPIQAGLSGMTRALKNRRTSPQGWQWIVGQVVVMALVAYVCIMGDLAADPTHTPRIFESLMLGAIAAYAATRFAGAITEHDGSPPRRAGPR